ncbi:hypothetical protein ACTXT7_000836 [Hymenolepis weldensis]
MGIHITASKRILKYLFDDPGCTIPTKLAVHIPEFKFHSSSPELQQVLVRKVQCFLTVVESANDLI